MTAPEAPAQAAIPQPDLATASPPARADGTGWNLVQRILRRQDRGRTPVEVGRLRLALVFGAFTVVFVAIAGQLVNVSLLGGGVEARQLVARKPAPPERGEILDRNGQLLAATLPTTSVYADPRKVLDAEDTARRLHQVFPDVPLATLVERLASERTFVYVRRNISPQQMQRVNSLGLPGVYFQEETRRLYPQGPVVSQVLGFSDVDNQGLGGIERQFNDRLRTGETIQLSLDLRVQHMLRQELITAMTRFSAIGAAGVVLDARTAEVLAMVSLPDFDPNDPGRAPDDARFNRATLGVYEMGSTFKIFNTAMGLEAGVTSMSGGYDASAPIRIGRFEINDDHAKNRWMSTPEIFKYSSNIGSAKMALDVGAAGQRQFLERLRLLQPSRLEVPEVGRPQFPKAWRPINVMTIAFGHGISVSPIMLAAATAPVVNGGFWREPTLLRRELEEVPAGEPIMSPRTSADMRRLMRLVVAEGTGRNANVDGYVTGGKTGTAEKIGPGGYQKNKRISSFVGAFPLHDPKYVVFVMLDEPKGIRETFGFATAGWVAAPTFARVVSRIGPLLGVPPVDETTPEIRQIMAVTETPRPGGQRVSQR
ncbi:MAG: penicillin-binding protein 2 [Alphaproteobacteria bacterium]|nr:penicillin-binding protein 2 [Alphaproteobacteria bacterium]